MSMTLDCLFLGYVVIKHDAPSLNMQTMNEIWEMTGRKETKFALIAEIYMVSKITRLFGTLEPAANI